MKREGGERGARVHAMIWTLRKTGESEREKMAIPTTAAKEKDQIT
tara:strand:+ start:986 stop:1120 length:135 start_codon:yes stop_codon:yes gene_type:complete